MGPLDTIGQVEAPTPRRKGTLQVRNSSGKVLHVDPLEDLHYGARVLLTYRRLQLDRQRAGAPDPRSQRRPAAGCPEDRYDRLERRDHWVAASLLTA